MPDSCPVCITNPAKCSPREGGDYFECARCGSFVLTGTARAILSQNLDRRARAAISHAIYRMTSQSHWPRISSDLVRSTLDQNNASLNRFGFSGELRVWVRPRWPDRIADDSTPLRTPRVAHDRYFRRERKRQKELHARITSLQDAVREG